MRPTNYLVQRLDWIAVSLYLILVIFGWVNLYAANFNPEHPVFFDTGKEYFKQLIWIGLSGVLIWAISLTDSKFFVEFAYIFWGFTVFLLLTVLIFGKEVNGARAWFEIGSFRIQPAEFTKVAVVLSVSRIMSRFNFSFNNYRHLAKLALILGTPILLIFFQNDTGSALVYFSLVLVMYREGLNPIVLVIGLIAAIVSVMTLIVEPATIYIVLGIGLLAYLWIIGAKNALKLTLIGSVIVMLIAYVLLRMQSSGSHIATIVLIALIVASIILVYLAISKRDLRLFIGTVVLWVAMGFAYSSNYFFTKILSDYQLKRIQVTLGLESDLQGAGYNVNQSKIAIGSGGVMGKGFLQGTQTKFNFVPEQSTDFIFCTVGEEWGFLGTTAVLITFLLLLFRLIFLAERQHSDFSRIYGYGLVSILFFHIAVNIGMTIGLAPVIGIPLPLFSYGGSSLWGFTLLLFIFLRLDTNRAELIR